MDLQKTSIVPAGFKDLQKGQMAERIVAEVVLLDKSPPTAVPILYILKEKVLPKGTELTSAHMSIPKDAFVMIGDVSLWDKKGKTLTLSNGNTVSYKHVIVSSAVTPTTFNTSLEEAFIAGLHALIDGLKMQQKVPISLEAKQLKLGRKPVQAKISHDDKLKQLAELNMAEGKKGAQRAGLSETSARMFEVQL